MSGKSRVTNYCVEQRAGASGGTKVHPEVTPWVRRGRVHPVGRSPPSGYGAFFLVEG
jgi:hypothetical protein